jgi:hypothetical protein
MGNPAEETLCHPNQRLHGERHLEPPVALNQTAPGYFAGSIFVVIN